MKHRYKYPHSSKTTTIESYYQTTGSDSTQIPICNNSIEERSINSLRNHHHQAVPIFCYCQLPSTYCQEQQSFHLYHEIPLHKSPVII